MLSIVCTFGVEKAEAFISMWIRYIRIKDKTKDEIDVYSEFISLYTSIFSVLEN